AAIEINASVRRVSPGPQVENLERPVSYLQPVIDVGQQSQPRRVEALNHLFFLKHGQSVLGRRCLLELLEHVGLKNPVIKLLRRQANRFPKLGGGVAHAPSLSQSHGAIEIRACILRGALLGAIENLYRFEKTSLAQQLGAFCKLGVKRLRARLGGDRGRRLSEEADEQDHACHDPEEFQLPRGLGSPFSIQGGIVSRMLNSMRSELLSSPDQGHKETRQHSCVMLLRYTLRCRLDISAERWEVQGCDGGR